MAALLLGGATPEQKVETAVAGAYLRATDGFHRISAPLGRIAIFLIFFWFGAVKLVGLSPATGLAEVLTARTVGMHYFHAFFYVLALLECVIGVLFLFPRATRIALPLLFVHMAIVCSPLILTPDQTWLRFAVPNMEGQYIIKNAAVIAVAIGIAGSTQPAPPKLVRPHAVVPD